MRTKRVNWAAANLALAVVIALISTAPFAVAQNTAPAKKPWSPPRTADGQPDIQGIWSNASIIALERPKELEGKQFFTAEELTAYEERLFVRTTRDRPPAPGSVGTYNDFWWDRDSKRALNLRTSLIVDPPNGRVPPLTPEAQKRVDAEADRKFKRGGPPIRCHINALYVNLRVGRPGARENEKQLQLKPDIGHQDVIRMDWHIGP